MFFTPILNWVCLFVLLIVLLIVSSGASSDGIQIFHEGEDIPIKALIQHTVDEELKVAWYKGDDEVSICSQSEGCSELSAETNTSLKVLVDEKYFESLITIKHASKKQCALWTLKYLGSARVEKPEELYHCQITFKNTPTSDIERNCKVTLNTLNNDNGYTTVIVVVVLACIITSVIVLCGILCVMKILPLMCKQDKPQHMKSYLKQVYTNGFNIEVLFQPIEGKFVKEKNDSEKSLI